MSDISYLSSSTSTAVSSASAASSDETTSGISEEQTVFLSMLLTQLENQNPLDPVDTTEFTSQLVSYSSLEQQMETNDKLDSLISSLDSTSSLSAFSYIGTEVDIDSNASVMADGEAQWRYALEESASNITLDVSDSNGDIVASYDSDSTEAGTYTFVLEDADLEASLDEGAVLYLSISATNSDGDQISTTTNATMSVTGVETSGGDITLIAGDLSFSTDDITAMRQKSS